MAHPMSVSFLGTSSGGGPTENRNCSSLICDFLGGNNNLWMVDCAEGTTRQFALQPHRQNASRLKMSQVSKLFVTHMHADHIMGITTFLRNILGAPRIDSPPPPSNAISHRRAPIIQIYGPSGLRSFLRQNLKMTFTRCENTYVVHELLCKDDPVIPCNPPVDEHDPMSGSDFKDWDVLHCSEVPGRDIRADNQGLWRDIAPDTHSRRATQIQIHASPILHRGKLMHITRAFVLLTLYPEPCIGYVFNEISYPKRKVVILGDTCDPSPIIPLCSNPRPSLLIHEATDSTISPETDDAGRLSKRQLPDVMKTTLARGHSTTSMAGEFAKLVNAQMLVLNHIGSRFPAPRINDNGQISFARRVLEDLERHATDAWDPPLGHRAIVALDFMRVQVPLPMRETNISTSNLVYSSTSVSAAGPSSVAISTLSLAQSSTVESDTLNSVSGNSRSVEVTGHGVQGVFKPTKPKRKIG
ncbi:hypothetical protein AGABI1DRAFT_125422 [Agaricus bisporus var. burnettii JB137-S8]|uniref:Metallo-beta-lactamase domain-containing protein n=1 Tax=Agaricus bisporus var. burnettii (strain JB137-S8 / ATCC MYA-4627 / FGSC 10392) TaxID=597362 RepID=K5Y4I3_AGABU|nr:uncharacterized protein AGABI1DRAFT_125422 [Agaricus bisporus var. burnettii JB137-S8]EKM82945.1 hypothetical protein AGABI1DRAFT_125422 [Agaricus bisporus var. burnettii JB137-S8]